MIIRYRWVYEDGKKGDVLCVNKNYGGFRHAVRSKKVIGYEMCAVGGISWITPPTDVVTICFFPKK
jgi:hypothetical protein